ncbi:group III truncated hemoglobin [Aureimonas leprariae]|uniref:Group III truncated hemoglobin n=1 Tax=Plantimonas leprariae TaxID=2615207 RepID=A0A7V7PNB4_9HYPH|nr:group III truncated hemoglobin [Aureimonas leprariae]
MQADHRPQLDEIALLRLVDRFYERVRADPLLAPVFGAAVSDWDDHLARLTDFWSSVMLTSGRYKGNPVALHLLHAGAMTPERFERWLALWTLTSGEMLPADTATIIQGKAARIAESLQLAIEFRPSPAA